MTWEVQQNIRRLVIRTIDKEDLATKKAIANYHKH